MNKPGKFSDFVVNLISRFEVLTSKPPILVSKPKVVGGKWQTQEMSAAIKNYNGWSCLQIILFNWFDHPFYFYTSDCYFSCRSCLRKTSSSIGTCMTYHTILYLSPNLRRRSNCLVLAKGWQRSWQSHSKRKTTHHLFQLLIMELVGLSFSNQTSHGSFYLWRETCSSMYSNSFRYWSLRFPVLVSNRKSMQSTSWC